MRHFDRPNTEPPECVLEMAARVPPCFDRHGWAGYLIVFWRSVLNDAPARARLHRGELPPYCEDCLPEYEARMRAAGRCTRPPEQLELIDPVVSSPTVASRGEFAGGAVPAAGVSVVACAEGA